MKNDRRILQILDPGGCWAVYEGADGRKKVPLTCLALIETMLEGTMHTCVVGMITDGEEMILADSVKGFCGYFKPEPVAAQQPDLARRAPIASQKGAPGVAVHELSEGYGPEGG